MNTRLTAPSFGRIAALAMLFSLLLPHAAQAAEEDSPVDLPMLWATQKRVAVETGVSEGNDTAPVGEHPVPGPGRAAGHGSDGFTGAETGGVG